MIKSIANNIYKKIPAITGVNDSTAIAMQQPLG